MSLRGVVVEWALRSTWRCPILTTPEVLDTSPELTAASAPSTPFANSGVYLQARQSVEN